MKKIYWVLSTFIVVIIFSGAYLFYLIPRTENISGQLISTQTEHIELGSSFKLRLEIRPQGESQFSTLSTSKSKPFQQFPQHFILPVLTESLLDNATYQLHVQVTNAGKLLYAHADPLSLSRQELIEKLTINMVATVKPEPKSVPVEIIKIEPKEKKLVIEEAEGVKKTEPELLKIELTALLDKKWRLDNKDKSNVYLLFETQTKLLSGSAGCNKIQGGYQVEQSALRINFIAGAKRCESGMAVEKAFLTALPKVRSWFVQGDILKLYDQNKQVLLQLKQQ